MRRVAVTGTGAVTPLGLDVPSTWRAALAGESGIDWISTFDTDGLPVRIAGEVTGFDPTQVVPAKEARRLERNVLFGVAAGREALADAGLNGFDPTRVGIVFGSAIGGVPGILEQADTLRERGPNYAVVSACATGSHAVGEAAEMIKRGAADAVLAGGTESCLVPLILAGFTAMRGLAVEDEDPTRASRPFDATRAGFVMAEGAGALLLEDWETAERRGADIYAEVLGYGASNDAHHMAQPEPEATGVAAMMAGALERAGVDRERVGYINAHGTSTPLGDAAETKAIKDVFGAHADELAVSSTKSMMGHTFGAAGAVEAIMCALALRDGVLPPTINYEQPDPTCDLDYVPNEARRAVVDVALSNAMGLGGHNGCVLLGRAA